MNNLIKYILYFYASSNRKKLNIIFIMLIYIKVKFMVSFFPLIRYQHLFNSNHSQANDLQRFLKEFQLIKKVVDALPGSSTCLIESLVAHFYLRQYNLNVPIYLGVRTKNTFQAHAWIYQSRSSGFTKIEF